MRVFKVWDKVAECYVKGGGKSSARYSCFDKTSTANKVGSRLCKEYEVHTYRLERILDES